MRSIFLFALFFLSAFDLAAQEMKYSRARIFADDNGLKHLASEGVTIDHGLHKRGVFFESDFSVSELRKVRELGYRYEVLIDDVKAEYKNPLRSSSARVASVCGSSTTSITTPSGFSLGSMGGFYTYQEMLNQLDTMSARFPGLISVKAAADVITTIEGRPVYYVKISDNPAVDEPEPEMLYTALHHAREPAGMQQLIFYMYYLLENYSSDPEIQAIVNNTEMYFIPCINPDGYIENETNDPTGGGMWRKNMRNNGDGTYGIDLNRNYGYFWGYDNTGSSPNTSSDTYRGTSAFSEPETQIMKNFANAHEFRIAINYHTYGNLLVHPWGYESIYTPDSAVFTDFATALTRENHYLAGTALQTVGYNVNGGSDDWLYGDVSGKPKVYSFTPEAGDAADGFWPASFLIEDICKGNITQNITAAQIILKYALASDKEPQFISQTTGYLNYSIKRLGLDTGGTYTVTIVPVGPGITSTGAPKMYTGMQLLEVRNDSISYSLGAVASGQQVRYAIIVDNGIYAHTDTITKYFGQPVIAFNSSGSAMTGFTGTAWGITNEYAYSPSTSVTDSPNSTYNGNAHSVINLTNPISLSNTTKATLRYNARWEIEAGWDYAQVQISTDNGSTWTPLCGKFTKPGNQNQDLGQPVYDGTQVLWVNEEIDLSSYINQNVRIRFAMVSDGFVELDGFYFDDLVVEKLPSSPTGIELPTPASFEIFPNPATGELSISSSGSYVARVYNNLGMIVTEGRFNGSGIIDIHALSAGVYTVEVENENADRFKKRVVIY